MSEFGIRRTFAAVSAAIPMRDAGGWVAPSEGTVNELPNRCEDFTREKFTGALPIVSCWPGPWPGPYVAKSLKIGIVDQSAGLIGKRVARCLLRDHGGTFVWNF